MLVATLVFSTLLLFWSVVLLCCLTLIFCLRTEKQTINKHFQEKIKVLIATCYINDWSSKFYAWNLLNQTTTSGLLNPCPVGNPMTLANGVTALCASSDQCTHDHWCHKVSSTFTPHSRRLREVFLGGACRFTCCYSQTHCGGFPEKTSSLSEANFFCYCVCFQAPSAAITLLIGCVATVRS